MSEVTSTVQGSEMESSRSGVAQETIDVEHPVGEITGDQFTTAIGRESVAPLYKLPPTDLGSFLARPVEIYSGTLASTDTVNQVLDIGDPWALFFANPAVANKTANFKYYRGTLELTVIVTAPGNAYGMYAFTCLPGANPSNVSLVGTNLYWQNCMQGDISAFVDCSRSANVEVRLPFFWPEDYKHITTDTTGRMWRMYLTCLAPLDTAIPGGVKEAAIQVFARSPDIDMVIPLPQGKKFIDKAKGVADKARQLQESKAVSKGAAKVAEMATKLSAVPVIGSFAAPVAQFATAAGSIASMFGFTRDNAYREPTTVAFRTFSALPNVDGPDTSEIAGLSADNAISVDPTLSDGTTADCASFADLFPRPVAVANVTWKPENAKGTILLSLPVTPFVATTSPSGLSVLTTTAGYVGLPFRYWRGDVRYKVVIACSNLHRGALQFAWLPNFSSPTTDLTNVSFNTIRELESGFELDIVVGYARNTPVMQTQLVVPPAIVTDDFINGKFIIKVVNPLRSQSDTSEVRVVVFQSAEENMQFGVPANESRLFDGSYISTYFLQHEGTLSAPVVETDDEVLWNVVPKSTAYPLKETIFGEAVSSVRALMQKPSLLFSYEATPWCFIQPLGPTASGGPPVTTSYPSNVWTWAGWYKAMYVAVAASERLKIVRTAAEDTECAVEIGSVPAGVAQIPGVPEAYGVNSTVNWLSLTGLETTVPYYGYFKFLNGATAQGVLQRGRTTYMRRLDDLAMGEGYARYWSFGPDIRLAGFRQTPSVWFGANNYGIQRAELYLLP